MFSILRILLCSTFLVALSSKKPEKSIELSVVEKIQANEKLNSKAFKKAYEYYLKNKEDMKLSDQYIAIADFTKKSSEKRLAIINLNTSKVDFYKVSHGKGSDKNHDLILDSFSDQPGSYATPLGFHKMTNTYKGKHGLSLKMEGLEKQNKNSSKRAIVLHGADYVSWDHTGRSQGCPAVEKQFTKKIIEQLKDGSLFYHYNN